MGDKGRILGIPSCVGVPGVERRACV